MRPFFIPDVPPDRDLEELYAAIAVDFAGGAKVIQPPGQRISSVEWVSNGEHRVARVGDQIAIATVSNGRKVRMRAFRPMVMAIFPGAPWCVVLDRGTADWNQVVRLSGEPTYRRFDDD